MLIKKIVPTGQKYDLFHLSDIEIQTLKNQ